MNATASRKWWISAVVTVGLVLAVWAVGSVLAQGPDEPQTTPSVPPEPPPGRSERPSGPAGGGADETMAFTYQGILEFDGQPATGLYDFYISLWGDSSLTQYIGTCDDVRGNLTDGYVLDIYVEDGLFTLYLICNTWNTWAFDGDWRWLDLWAKSVTEVPWTNLPPPQPISPVPYAFSLFPGANVRGGVSSPSAMISVTQQLNLTGDDDAFAVYGYGPGTGIYGDGLHTGVKGFGRNRGVYGYSGHIGVFGESNHYTGVGGLFVNTGGGNLLAANNVASPWDLKFRVSSTGAAYADGGWQGAADFAELMTTEDVPTAYEHGDVLVISTEADRSVALSTEPYSTLVIGVYSENPGFVGSPHAMEEQRDDEIPVAVVGIVFCKASAENGPIQRGDLLVTSSTPGHAMRAGSDPPVGTLVGKALEGLEEGTGLIQIVVTLQ